MLQKIIEKKYDRATEKMLEASPYNLIETLDMGGYGTTYIVEKNNKRYVLKRLKGKYRKNKQVKHQFIQEISMLQQLKLSFLPTVFHEGYIEEVPYYIMSFMPGATFEELIFGRYERYSIDDVLIITRNLLQLIRQLHKEGIVHRDLRIPNIFMYYGELSIIDFGLADFYNHEPFTGTNPKLAKNHISDLYFVGHFMLFLLYSTYDTAHKKEQSWQLELQLPAELQTYIERLLTTAAPFASADEALNHLPKYTL